jgi:hypothetical protein
MTTKRDCELEAVCSRCGERFIEMVTKNTYKTYIKRGKFETLCNKCFQKEVANVRHK